MEYEIRFAGPRVEKEFFKFISRLNKKLQKRIYSSIIALSHNPRPPGKKFKFLETELPFYNYVAHYRLRIGDYRIFYDIDDADKIVVLLAIALKEKDIYK